MKMKQHRNVTNNERESSEIAYIGIRCNIKLELSHCCSTVVGVTGSPAMDHELRSGWVDFPTMWRTITKTY